MLVRRFLAIVAVVFILAAPLWANEGAAPEQNPQDEANLVQAARAMRTSGRVQLNFKELEIATFIRFMSELLGENLLVDPGVKGKVSVVSPRPISFKEARQVMLSILEMNGLTLKDMGGYSKVLPIAAGPAEDYKVRTSPVGPGLGEQIVVQVMPLGYVKSGYVLEPVKLAVPGLAVTPLQSNNGVLLAGKASVVQKGVSVIRALDSKDSIRSVKLYALKHASPANLANHFNNLSKDVSAKLSGIIAIADIPSRKLILVGSSQALRESERMMKELDVPPNSSPFKVYRLKNADAKTVSEQLSKILAVAAKLQADPQGATPASVVPDLATNSLILAVPEGQYEPIFKVIQELDMQPKQVLIRGLIAEVNLNRLRDAGIDWAAWGGGVGDALIYGGEAQLGSQGVPTMFMEWFRELSKKEEVTYDIHGNAVTTTNYQGKGLLFAYIKLLNQNNAINVLSMPRLMCTDNMESYLQVGQVIPQLTSRVADTTNPASQQSNYNYKDTGLILKVTPHVRSGNLVALEIEQKVEELLTTYTNLTPVTSKREIKTSVLVENGQTVILGGFIKEAEKSIKNRVPGLSYIPLLGNLFQSSSKQKEKIDLMIFLTPYIMETPGDARAITTQIASGDQTLSEPELQINKRGEEEFKEAVKQQ